MRTTAISFPAQVFNAICATQTITATAGAFLVLNGTLAAVNNFNAPASSTSPGTPNPYSTTAANIQPYQYVTLPGIARPITAFASSSATGVVIKVFGNDILGNFQTASFVGPSGGSLAATDCLATGSGTDFHVIQAVSISASMANICIGTGATGVTQWVKTDTFKTPFSVMVGANSTATTQTFSVVSTMDDVNTATAPTTATTGPVVNIATTSFYAAYTASSGPVNAVQGWCTAHTATQPSASGSLTFQFTQQG